MKKKSNFTKKYIKAFTFLGLFLLAASLNAQEKKWTLEECVYYALENNISIKLAKNTLLSNNQDVLAAKGQFLPSVGAGVTQSLSLGQSEIYPGAFVDRTFHSTSVGVSLSQTIFDGFANTYAYKQSKLTRETNELELNRIKDDISLNVVNAYLNVLFNKENLETAQAQYEFSKKQLNQVQDLVDAGVQPRANIYDAEATLSRDEQQVTLSENSVNLALLSLSQLLQVPFKDFNVEDVEVENPSAELLYKSIEPILDYAVANRNEIKVAEKNIESSKLSTKIAEGGYLPSLTFGYGYNSGANFSNLISYNSFFEQLNDNRGHSFSLSLSIPIFSRFANKTSVAKSVIQEDNSLLNLQQAKLDLETNIQSAFTDAQAAFKAFEAAKKTLASQELAFANSKERFDIGAMTSYDLEQARVQLINAESSLINAKYDFIFKTKVLDFYLGKPLTN
ncbi:TolC family protein [Neotamlana laminarinivorans]|uniref:TolC family protein n=1 Tax=Neotamlana laminarinivorans TaxID=2883124 RepID=A0A9X1I1J9_9FLAO|nr:TolC family protein [Tamlana laminarinivorans]MCB4799295.1 TolC family protein [Tamlana laminarinivorans]